MPYELAIADSVRDRLRKMIKKDSVGYKRILKVFDQLADNPEGVGKWMKEALASTRDRTGAYRNWDQTSGLP